MATKRNTAYVHGTDYSDKGWSKRYTVPFNNISEPGTYYFHPTGMLFRVPPDGVEPGHSPLINICWNDECYCTKISDDPWLPLNKAREVCANWDFAVNF
jgi:hypothetical protein